MDREIITAEIPIQIQVKIALEFEKQKGYFAPQELVKWLQDQGYNIHCTVLSTSLNPCFVFLTEQDYTLFMLKWT